MLKARFGEPAPYFIAPANNRPDYHFSSVAGRNVLLWFASSGSLAQSSALFDFFLAQRQAFDDQALSLFIVSADPRDKAEPRFRDFIPGIRVLWDFEGQIAKLYGMEGTTVQGNEFPLFKPGLLLLDHGLRGLAWFDFDQPPDQLWLELQSILSCIAPIEHGQAQIQAPVLMIPRIFEPAFCRELIAYYNARGGGDSGYMRTRLDGTIEGVIDYSFKRRRDCLIEDDALAREARHRIEQRLIPQIRKVFRFRVTRMERYLIACYDSKEGGYFRPHRDNDGNGHRQFAVTLNLNSEDYEGGDLKFPEYGQQVYRAPTGGACVFSCFLLHEATPVTRGTRYAFVPFLYDEESAKIREQNNARYVDPKHHYKVSKSDIA